MKPITTILFAFLLFACSSKPQQEFRTTKDLSEITGETFVLPSDPKWVILERDTIVQIKKEPRLVVYLNGSSCTPCALKELQHWKPIIEQVDSQILFVLQTDTDNEAVKQALIDEEFDFPVLCDENSDFARYNLLPKNELYHVFLLDADNEVIMAGNPLISLKQWDVFKRTFYTLNNKKL